MNYAEFRKKYGLDNDTPETDTEDVSDFASFAKKYGIEQEPEDPYQYTYEDPDNPNWAEGIGPPEAKSEGFLDFLGNRFSSGYNASTAGYKRAAGDLMDEVVEDYAGSNNPYTPWMKMLVGGQVAREYAKEDRNEARGASQKANAYEKDINNPVLRFGARTYGDVAASAPSLLPLAAIPLGGPAVAAAAVVPAAQKFGSDYDEGQEAGLTPSESLVRAVPRVATEYAFETLPGSKLFKWGKGFIPRFAGRSVGEGFSEVGTEIADTTLDAAAGAATDDDRLKKLADVTNLPERAIRSFAAGVAGAGPINLLSVPGELHQERTETKTDKAPKAPSIRTGDPAVDAGAKVTDKFFEGEQLDLFSEQDKQGDLFAETPKTDAERMVDLEKEFIFRQAEKRAAEAEVIKQQQVEQAFAGQQQMLDFAHNGPQQATDNVNLPIPTEPGNVMQQAFSEAGLRRSPLNVAKGEYVYPEARTPVDAVQAPVAAPVEPKAPSRPEYREPVQEDLGFGQQQLDLGQPNQPERIVTRGENPVNPQSVFAKPLENPGKLLKKPKTTNPAPTKESVKVDLVELRKKIEAEEADGGEVKVQTPRRPEHEVRTEIKTDNSSWGQTVRDAIKNKRVRFLTKAQISQEFGETNAIAFYHPDANQVIINAENVPEGYTTAEIVAHETTHAAYQQELEQAGTLRKTYDRVREMAGRGNKFAKDAVDAVNERMKKKPLSADQMMKEIIAHTVQNVARARKNAKPLGQAAFFIKDLISNLKARAKNMGFKVTDMSINDLELAAKRAADEYVRGADKRSDLTMQKVAERRAKKENIESKKTVAHSILKKGNITYLFLPESNGTVTVNEYIKHPVQDIARKNSMSKEKANEFMDDLRENGYKEETQDGHENVEETSRKKYPSTIKGIKDHAKSKGFEIEITERRNDESEIVLRAPEGKTFPGGESELVFEWEFPEQKQDVIDEVHDALNTDGTQLIDADPNEYIEETSRKKPDTVAKMKPTKQFAESKLTGGRNTFSKWWSHLTSSYQGMPPEVRRWLEENYGILNAKMAEVRATLNRLTDALDAAGLKGEQLNSEEVLNKHPDLKKLYKQLRKEVDLASVDIAEEFLKNVENPTKQELKIVEAIKANLGKYFYRTYKVDAPGKEGKAYGETRWKNYQSALKKMAANKPVSEFTSAELTDYEKVEAAKKYLEERFMKIKDPREMTVKQLDEAYEFWSDTSGEGKSRASKEAYLDDIISQMGNRGEKLEDMIQELLKVTDQVSNVTKFFKGRGILERTIVTQREKVPQAIRDLWGENLDPVVSFAQTIYKQQQFLANIRTLNTMYENGKGEWLFTEKDHGTDPNFKRKLYNQTLKGNSYGPLEGMRTAPIVKMAVDTMLDASRAVMAIAPVNSFPTAVNLRILNHGYEYWQKVVRGFKYASVVIMPLTWAYNYAGSFLSVIQSGNFKFANGLRAMKAAKDLVNIPEKRNVSKDVLELFRANVVDSVIAGELKEAEMKALMKDMFHHTDKDIELLNDLTWGNEKLKGWGRKATNYARDKLPSAKRTITDMYAGMDMWTKLGNYWYNKTELKKYYDARGEKISDRELEKKAAEITKRTSYSYSRTPQIAKITEQSGATMFFTYFLETYRTTWNNLVQGMTDVAEGMKEGDKAGAIRTNFGMKRLLGTAATIPAHQLMQGALVTIAAAMGLGGGDDKDHDKIMQGMDERNRNSIVIPIKQTEDGKIVYLEVSRADPYDPINKPFRTFLKFAMAGKPEQALEEAGKEMGNLFIANSAVRNTYNIAKDVLGFGIPEDTRTARESAAFYRSYREMMDKNNVPISFSDSALRAAEMTPGGPWFIQMLAGVNQWKEGDVGAGVAATTMAGGKLVIFDPERAVAQRYRQGYARIVNEEKGKLQRRLNTGRLPSDAELEAAYKSSVVEEYKAFLETRQAVDATIEAVGPKGMTLAMKQLKDSNAPDWLRSAIRFNNFRPQTISDKFMEAREKQLIERSATPEEKQKIKSNFKAIRSRLKMLQKKYARTYEGE